MTTTLTDSDLQAIAADLQAQGAKIAASLQAPSPVPTPTPSPMPVPTADPNLWALSVDEQFTAAKLDTKTWWAPYDNADGTAGVGRRKGSLATLRNGQLIIAAERPDANNTDYDQWFSTGVAMGPRAQIFGRWEFAANVTDGPGFWPCIQLWPDGKWPDDIELDIFEAPDGTRNSAVATMSRAIEFCPGAVVRPAR